MEENGHKYFFGQIQEMPWKKENKMRKIFLIYDYEGEIIGILSDKFFKSPEEIHVAISDNFHDYDSLFWSDIYEFKVVDTIEEIERKRK